MHREKGFTLIEMVVVVVVVAGLEAVSYLGFRIITGPELEPVPTLTTVANTYMQTLPKQEEPATKEQVATAVSAGLNAIGPVTQDGKETFDFTVPTSGTLVPIEIHDGMAIVSSIKVQKNEPAIVLAVSSYHGCAYVELPSSHTNQPVVSPVTPRAEVAASPPNGVSCSPIPESNMGMISIFFSFLTFAILIGSGVMPGFRRH